jgi:hypothetical protein
MKNCYFWSRHGELIQPMQLKNKNNFKVRGSIKYVNVVFLALFMHRMLIKERKILRKGSQIEIKLDFFFMQALSVCKILGSHTANPHNKGSIICPIQRPYRYSIREHFVLKFMLHKLKISVFRFLIGLES